MPAEWIPDKERPSNRGRIAALSEAPSCENPALKGAAEIKGPSGKESESPRTPEHRRDADPPFATSSTPAATPSAAPSPAKRRTSKSTTGQGGGNEGLPLVPLQRSAAQPAASGETSRGKVPVQLWPVVNTQRSSLGPILRPTQSENRHPSVQKISGDCSRAPVPATANAPSTANAGELVAQAEEVRAEAQDIDHSSSVSSRKRKLTGSFLASTGSPERTDPLQAASKASSGAGACSSSDQNPTSAKMVSSLMVQRDAGMWSQTELLAAVRVMMQDERARLPSAAEVEEFFADCQSQERFDKCLQQLRVKRYTKGRRLKQWFGVVPGLMLGSEFTLAEVCKLGIHTGGTARVSELLGLASSITVKDVASNNGVATFIPMPVMDGAMPLLRGSTRNLFRTMLWGAGASDLAVDLDHDGVLVCVAGTRKLAVRVFLPVQNRKLRFIGMYHVHRVKVTARNVEFKLLLSD